MVLNLRLLGVVMEKVLEKEKMANFAAQNAGNLVLMSKLLFVSYFLFYFAWS